MTYKPGTQVTIIDGPYCGYSGRVFLALGNSYVVKFFLLSFNSAMTITISGDKLVSAEEQRVKRMLLVVPNPRKETV